MQSWANETNGWGDGMIATSCDSPHVSHPVSCVTADPEVVGRLLRGSPCDARGNVFVCFPRPTGQVCLSRRLHQEYPPFVKPASSWCKHLAYLGHIAGSDSARSLLAMYAPSFPPSAMEIGCMPPDPEAMGQLAPEAGSRRACSISSQRRPFCLLAAAV